MSNDVFVYYPFKKYLDEEDGEIIYWVCAVAHLKKMGGVISVQSQSTCRMLGWVLGENRF